MKYFYWTDLLEADPDGKHWEVDLSMHPVDECELLKGIPVAT